MQFKMEPKESIKSLKEPEKGSNRSSQIPETTRRPRRETKSRRGRLYHFLIIIKLKLRFSA